MYDIIIVGSGTAGMTAAIYSARANRKVLVIEQLICGGQIVNAEKVENYPGIKSISGADYSMTLFEQATELGAEFIFAAVTAVTKDNKGFTVTADNNTYDSHALIIATGAKNRPLGINGEERYIGKGISYCATCDGAFYKDKTTAIVGGGNTAIDDALYLGTMCKKVYVIHRRDAFRGEAIKVSAMKEKENIELVTDSIVTGLLGDDKITGVTVKSKLTNKETALNIDGLFVAIGQMPDNMIFNKLVNLDDKGYIVANEDCKTKTEGLFTAGDCRTKAVRQLSTAAGDGTVAAVTALEYITGLGY
ncbi:MAG TPA: thioredoxin-disulfide reductase [Clostridiales bacterium]|nr:thioredoxin-disulfide reductase [Clostridiales bacterium]